MNRVGSLPVHWSRYLRLTVIVSSPEIASSRSTTTWRVAAVEAGVGDHGQRLAEQRRQAEVVAEAGQRRAGDVVGADERAEDAGDRALAAAGRADQQQDLLQVEPAGDDVAEELLQRGDRVGVVGPQLVEEREPAQRLEGVGVVVERHRGLVEEPRVVGAAASRVSTSSSPLAQATITPVGASAPSIHAGCWTVSGRKQTAASASSRSAILCRFGAHGTTSSPSFVSAS